MNRFQRFSEKQESSDMRVVADSAWRWQPSDVHATQQKTIGSGAEKDMLR